MKRKGLKISFGKLSDDSKAWDIKFWQSVSTAERFKAASDMIRLAYKHKKNQELSDSLDKTVILSGSLADDR